MDEWDRSPSGEAEVLRSSRLLAEILSGLEREAIERLVAAGTEAQRVQSQFAVQAVRSLRAEIAARADGEEAPPRHGAVA